MGENYVLGSRDDDNQYVPYKVHPKMFEEMPVLMVGAGTQHVVVLTGESPDHRDFPPFAQEVLNYALPAPEPKPKPEKKPSARPSKAEPKKEAKQQEEEVKEELGKVAIEEEVKSTTSSKKRKRSDFEAALIEPVEEAKPEAKRKKENMPASQKAKSAGTAPAKKATPAAKKK